MTLVACLLPLMLVSFWTGVLQPQIWQLEASIDEMQQKLRTPLPLSEGSNISLEEELSVTEYQQIKMLFDTLNRYQLQIESGNYQFMPEQENTPGTLILTIPLHGKWLTLVQALRDVSRALPVKVETLNMNRPSPDTDELSITLQLMLLRGA